MLHFILILSAAVYFGSWNVCLDPGHGGSDEGAVGYYCTEKEVNLHVAFLARSYFEQIPDCGRVGMTRTTDIYVSLADRVGYANAGGYDRFASLHHNAFNGSVQGTETYCDTDGSSGSFAYRDSLHPYLVDGFGYFDRGVKTAGFYVVKYTQMPAVLGEASFLDYVSQWDESWRFAVMWNDHVGVEGWAYCAGTCESLFHSNIPSYQDRACDNSYPNFSMDDPLQWAAVRTTDSFGPDYLTTEAATQSHSVWWNPCLPVSGNYEVYVRWPDGAGRSSCVLYRIYHHYGCSTVVLDQSQPGGQWHSLGEYYFHEGTVGELELSTELCQAGESVAADGVLFSSSGTGSGEEEPGAAGPSLSVYPVPAVGSAVVDLRGISGGGAVVLYDLSGRALLETMFHSGESPVLNLRELGPGVYFLSVNTENGSSLCGKLVVAGE
ncbi:MAG: T9SS type A sorting domain-containing protein [Candidatus Aegiribacteria sp.]|nr:T9SS type A sorting domain-containing protein [Candidatus Aegiribacteria sp.]MBD3294501.1 T9SS type A sorting domain-containing protein [Candidatus Fermentibacteria bacterium]